MITRLQAYYGGNQSGWMSMPSGILSAFVKMLPVLRAEDQMREAQVVALGTGSMERKDRNKLVDRLGREISMEDGEPVRQVDPEARKMLIASAGIEVG